MSGYSEIEELMQPEVDEETFPDDGFMSRRQEEIELKKLTARISILERKLEEITNENHTEKL